MQYPLISEYKDAILNAEDNFNKLASLRPVLDGHGDPVMSSGNFAVVFKMTDGTKDYAIKCFTKEQEGRAEAYRQICRYLQCVPSPYMVSMQYLEKELFVDTNQSDDDEFPVLLMDWVEGVSLDRYVKKIKRNGEKRIRLANEFRELSFWLMGQEFAHGDLKPDNIIVTESGHLVLVDYDGMFIPSMRGQKSRELGTPLYRFKGRTPADFDEFSDDYACVFILLVLTAGCIAPVDFDAFSSPDAKDILKHFSAYFEHAQVAPCIAAFLLVASSGRLDRQVLYPLLAHRSGNNIRISTTPVPPPFAVAQPPTPNRQLSFTVNGVTFEMVPVEGGTFTMGATAEQGGDANVYEKPAHKVTLSSYAIGKYEVTQALWKAVMGDNPSNFKGDNLPVENVSWNDCQEFIKKLNSLTGQQFRLPTEAEWEFAARGGKKSKGYRYSGSNDLAEVAWYHDNSNSRTHPVGAKNPNELGIYDMSGNVWEWCNDWFGDYSSSAVSNPSGPSSGSIRVCRGGCWLSFARSCRVSYRDGFNPGSRDGYLGLRLVLPQQLLFTVNGVTFEMVPVEGGTFAMGATAEQGGDAYDSEKPAHKVTLSSYAIGKCEVTQALWKAVMGNNPSRFKGGDLPVENVSWNDCQEFLKKLNSLTGQQFRLPTEAEWEFAARGGRKSRHYKYSGSKGLAEVAWYGVNSNSQTHPVGAKNPNELGIYDMSGNVWEWCNDWFGDYTSSAVTNPLGPTYGSLRVYRGGSWRGIAGVCRVSNRYGDFPGSRPYGLGLRLVLPQQLMFTVNGVTFEMVPVEGGTFTMGATAEQGGDAYDSEKPAHKVTLSSYAIGKYEVTQALWKAVMGNNPSRFKGGDLPVENVSWNDCQEFIKKLNSLTGQQFRLPTEAEWEFAARGGRKSKGYKYSGSNDLAEVAWYGDNSSSQTHPVGVKKPNELGIYDMSGNVREWCNDWFGDYSSSAVSNPSGPSSGGYRVRRGGGWDYLATFCRVSSRFGNIPVNRFNYLGLRLVLPQQ